MIDNRFPWEAVTAVAAVVGLIGGFYVWVTSLVVERIVDRKNDEQLAKINGTYLRSAVAAEKFVNVDVRIDGVEDRMKELHQYTHTEVHHWRGQAHIAQAHAAQAASNGG